MIGNNEVRDTSKSLMALGRRAKDHEGRAWFRIGPVMKLDSGTGACLNAGGGYLASYQLEHHRCPPRTASARQQRGTHDSSALRGRIGSKAEQRRRRGARPSGALACRLCAGRLSAILNRSQESERTEHGGSIDDRLRQPRSPRRGRVAATGRRSRRGRSRDRRRGRRFHGHTGVRRGLAWAGHADRNVIRVERAGPVVAVAEGVDDLGHGDRFARVYHPAATPRGWPAVRGVIPDRTAGIRMQGLTTSHFATEFYPLQPGDVASLHGAAGGGFLLTHIIKLRGGRVIRRVSSADKVAVAKQAGAAPVIVDSEVRFAQKVIRLSDAVHVVDDGSGPEALAASLEALRRHGTFCWYSPLLGSGPSIGRMSLPKSIRIGYATFFDHIHTPELLRARAVRLFDGRPFSLRRGAMQAGVPLCPRGRSPTRMALTSDGGVGAEAHCMVYPAMLRPRAIVVACRPTAVFDLL